MSRAKILDHDSVRIFHRSKTAHDWWRFHQRCKLTIKLHLAVFNAMWGFDYEVSRQVGWCFIRDLQKGKLRDWSLEFKINGQVGYFPT